MQQMTPNNSILLGYYDSEISFFLLEEFFYHHGVKQPTLLGNVMLLPNDLIEPFCETFGVVMLSSVSDEMREWCKENIKSFYSIHGDEDTLSTKYILIQNADERMLFKLTWS